MNEQDMISCTKQFALRVMKLIDALPSTVQGRAIAGQLMRSGKLSEEIGNRQSAIS